MSHINNDLLVKYLLGEASSEEAQAMEAWINEDESHKTYFKQLKQIWITSKQLTVEPRIDENTAWENFQKRVADAKKVKQVVSGGRLALMNVAASAIFLIGLAVAAYFLIKNNTPDTAPREMIAKTAQNILVDTLPDGSVITLNKNSSVTYPKKFKGDTRTVTLTGEAFFNVLPDKEKPFIINVDDAQITVVGTTFNAKTENGNTEVVVESGIVSVAKTGKTVQLKAGEKLVIAANNNVFAKENVTDKLYNYYRSKQFVCDDTPLWKLVDVLNEAYDTTITIEKKELGQLRLNATFNNESLDKVLEIIHLTFDITVIKKNGQIILQ